MTSSPASIKKPLLTSQANFRSSEQFSIFGIPDMNDHPSALSTIIVPDGCRGASLVAGRGGHLSDDHASRVVSDDHVMAVRQHEMGGWHWQWQVHVEMRLATGVAYRGLGHE